MNLFRWVLFCGEAIPLGKVISAAAPVFWDPRFDHNLFAKQQICRIGISRHPLEHTESLWCNCTSHTKTLGNKIMCKQTFKKI